jgi:aryl-alcohol dehydrogenase-like predicted oxidoreductase
MHRRDFTVPIEESVGAMADLITEGKIGAIGLSEMSADTLEKAVATHPIAAMQTEYSPWTRNVEIAVLEATRRLGTALVAFSPVARGVLANGVRDPDLFAEKDIRRAMPRFSTENWHRNLALVDAFNVLAAEAGVTPAQLSLGWVLSRGAHPCHPRHDAYRPSGRERHPAAMAPRCRSLGQDRRADQSGNGGGRALRRQDPDLHRDRGIRLSGRNAG